MRAEGGCEIQQFGAGVGRRSRRGSEGSVRPEIRAEDHQQRDQLQPPESRILAEVIDKMEAPWWGDQGADDG